MDFLSRLIAGTGSSPTKQKVSSPAERLATCKKICAALQQIWRTSRFEDDVTTVHIANCLKRLNAVLTEESRKAAPHSCLHYVASSQIYIIVAKLSSQDADIVRAAAQFFHILIHGEAEGILDSKIFARSLTDLTRKYISNHAIRLDERAEEDLVERLFEVSTKIKLDPDILAAWFYPERDRSQTRDATGRDTRKNQFPLFYLLVEYVHHDGSTGDFARTGLLYLIETASKSHALEQWVIESDLAPQMASGLGALYSRLSRRLHGIAANEKVPAIIALSDTTSWEESDTQTITASQQEMKAYLSYLAFWQDTLDHSSSPEITDTLLDHFQVLFIQQLLYPSLLESSDIDGGSTASVLTHLFRTLDIINDSGLVERVLRYLLASPASMSSQQPRKRQQRMSVSRKKSMDKLAAFMEKTSEATPAPDLFTLTDLMVMSLKSRNPQTVVATLKLISVITSKHHKYTTLFKTCAAASNLRFWRLELLTRELTKLLDLATSINNSASLDQSYQWMLSDVQTMLEQHSCTTGGLPENHDLGPLESERCLTISRDCKIFVELVDLLKTFLGNETTVNLSLTEALMPIASCKYIAVRGWLLPAVRDVVDIEHELSNIFIILADHVKQIRTWRSQFPEWDELLAIRKEELMDESAAADPTNLRTVSGKSIQTQGSLIASSYAQSGRTSESLSSSRPTTPRGRKLPRPEFGSIDSTLSASPPAHAMATSPLRQTVFPPDSLDVASGRKISAAHDFSALLQTQVALPYQAEEVVLKPSFASLVERMKVADGSGEAGSTPGTSEGISSGAVTPSLNESRVRTTASLSHVLTNAVILQEFVLEIAAVVQVRASLFGEVEIL